MFPIKLMLPNKARVTKVVDFRPINLITILYKLIAKVLAKRLKKVLHETINGSLLALIACWKILDPILVANELLDDFFINKKDEWVFKIDFEMTYNMVD